MDSELYIYLGKQGNIHSFIHTIANKNKYEKVGKQTTDHQILNCLINENIVKNYDERVLVYTLDTDLNHPEVDVCHIYHAETKVAYTFEDNNFDLQNNISDNFKTLLKKDKNEKTVVFMYHYDQGCFCCFNVNIDLSDIVGENQYDCKIGQVENVITAKVIQ